MLDLKPLDTTKKVLVTGAAGFIGLHLSKQLLDKGMHVFGIDNINDYYDVSLKYDRLAILGQYDSFDFEKCDISDKESLDKIFALFEPDIVVNLAAQAGVRYSIENPRVYIESNIIGFFNILEACRNNPVDHLVFASSSSVYGNQEKIPFSVNDNVDRPISLYAATKKSNELMGYTYSHLYGIPVTGLRFFTVYGPFGRPDMAYFGFTKKIFNDEPIKIFNNGNMYRDFTYVADIIQGIESLLCNPPRKDEKGDQFRVYNIGNNKPEKLMHFIKTLENQVGKTAKKEFLPMQPGDVYQTHADVEGMINDFGFKPETSIEDGLNIFVEWYREYFEDQGVE